MDSELLTDVLRLPCPKYDAKTGEIVALRAKVTKRASGADTKSRSHKRKSPLARIRTLRKQRREQEGKSVEFTGKFVAVNT